MTAFAKMRSPKRAALIRDGVARMARRRSDVSPRTPDLRMEHGRLVARLKRQLGKIDRLGATAERKRKVLLTVRALVLVERRIEDPLAAARRGDDVSAVELRDRVDLMKPGAGIEVPS